MKTTLKMNKSIIIINRQKLLHCWCSVLRLQTGAPTDAIARRIRVKRVRRGALHTSYFLLSSLPRCNKRVLRSFYRFRAIGLRLRVEIENCISLYCVKKRREAADNFEFTKYVVEEIILLFSILLKKSALFKYLKGPMKLDNGEK